MNDFRGQADRFIELHRPVESAAESGRLVAPLVQPSLPQMPLEESDLQSLNGSERHLSRIGCLRMPMLSAQFGNLRKLRCWTSGNFLRD